MNGITAAMMAALCIGIVTLIVAMISRFLGRFNEETRRIADEMRRAQDSEAYIYWQSRLRRHYIRLLPFVSEKAAGRIYSRLFRKPKHSAEKKEYSDGLFHILAPSVLSVCLCAVCLCGMSWAWFTATGNTGVSTITAATYTVEVSVEPKTIEVTTGTTDGVTTVTFNKNGEYTVTLTANGTANYGRYLVKMDSTEYMSELVHKSGKVSFTVKARANDQISITPVWTDEDGTVPIAYASVTKQNINSQTYTLAGYAESNSNGEPVTGGQETVATTQSNDTTDIVNSTDSAVATTAQTTAAETAETKTNTNDDTDNTPSTDTDKAEEKNSSNTESADTGNTDNNSVTTPAQSAVTTNKKNYDSVGSTSNGEAETAGNTTGGTETAGNTTGGSEATVTD